MDLLYYYIVLGRPANDCNFLVMDVPHSKIIYNYVVIYKYLLLIIIIITKVLILIICINIICFRIR
jgi:hypothetical protein